MTDTVLRKSKTVTTAAGDYAALLKQVRQTIRRGKVRAQKAVEAENVRTAWEIGKHVLEHILLNKDRADYGAQVIGKLSKDLRISKSELNRMVEFARAYPIDAAPRQLPWSHYRELLTVNDAEKRKSITERAVKNHWAGKELRREIKKIKSNAQPIVEKIPEAPALGKMGVYRVLTFQNKHYYDLGFSIRYEIKGKVHAVTGPEPRDLYNYHAFVTSVYDGDTFHAVIDLGFGVALEQRLRLRTLDAPELNTREGEEARKALEKILMRRGGKIQIKTSKSDDQYGRYLADVYLDEKPIAGALLKTGVFTYRG